MPSSQLNTASKYRPDIDGLRAIAIISVVFYHAGFPGFPGGFVGVDVFFVISGYLITVLLFNEAMTSGRISLSGFYARRVRRLMPAGLLVLAVTLLLGGLFMLPGSSDQRILARSALAVAVFGSNFFFAYKTGGYFDDPSYSLPLLHTWSLSIEEQYYLIWPLLLLLFFRFYRTPNTEHKMRLRVILALTAMLVVSLAWCISSTPKQQNMAFYLLPARVWEFAIGGIVGLAGSAFHARLYRHAETLALTGLGLIIYSVTVFTHSTPFPGWAAMLPVFGSAALIFGLSANEHGLVRRLLCARPLVFIGILSYSWYLWHWPLLSIYRIYNLGAQNLLDNALIVALALGLAWLSFIWIERPIRLHRPWLFGRNRSTLFAGLGIIFCTILLAVALLAWNRQQKSTPEFQRIQAAREDRLPLTCLLNQYRPLTKLPEEDCVHGPDKAHPRVLLWGDSHADHMMPMLVEAFPRLSIYQIAMGGCVPILGFESQLPTPQPYCADFNQRVLQKITELQGKGLETVILSARWPLYLGYPNIGLASQRLGDSQADDDKRAQLHAQMQHHFEATLTALEKLGLRVLVLGPIPSMVYQIPQCIGSRDAAYCNISRETNATGVGQSSDTLAEVIKRHPNTRLAQLMDYFCDAETCYAARDGKILYYDNNHISATTARDLAGYLKDDLDWAGARP